MALTSSSVREGATVTITLQGDVDLPGVGDFEDMLATYVGTDLEEIRVDLAGVGFIDSAGINALLKARRTAEDHGQTFVVTEAGGLVRELLEMTGVWSHLAGRA